MAQLKLHAIISYAELMINTQTHALEVGQSPFVVLPLKVLSLFSFTTKAQSSKNKIFRGQFNGPP